MVVTFAEAVGILTMAAEQQPQLTEAVRVICREYDRVYRALDHYADLSRFNEDEAEEARVALRRIDPPIRVKGDAA